jgi:hypothetical protein
MKYPVVSLEIITASFAALSFIMVIIQIERTLDVRKPLYLNLGDTSFPFDLLEKLASFHESISHAGDLVEMG